jgi:hypothetical protein
MNVAPRYRGASIIERADVQIDDLGLPIAPIGYW